MRNTAVLVLTILLFSVGCTDIDDKLNIQIRVDNSTSKNFTQVAVDDLIYLDVKADSKSAYQAKDTFIAPRELTVAADSIKASVSIDNFSQDTLQPGRYTFKINTFSDEEGLQFEVIED